MTLDKVHLYLIAFIWMKETILCDWGIAQFVWFLPTMYEAMGVFLAPLKLIKVASIH